MQSIQTTHLFSLKEIKPLEKLIPYRQFCLESVQQSLAQGREKRTRCPIDDCQLQPWGEIAGLEWGCCKKTESIFFLPLPAEVSWRELLKKVRGYQLSPNAFYSDIQLSRLENVYAPKKQWIENSLRLQGLRHPIAAVVDSAPSPWTQMLETSSLFSQIHFVDEAKWPGCDCALLFETLDRSFDPRRLLQQLVPNLKKGGLLFVTALVASGFDMKVLGSKSAYLYPPDRANCFSLKGLTQLLESSGLKLIEVSTPGVLDVEVVKAHIQQGWYSPASAFERQLLSSEPEVLNAFQQFLQQTQLSSFARIVAEKI